MQPFLGSLMLTGFNYAPTGFQPCNGQTLSIAQFQALFSLLGTYFGGNGVNTFMLPNLQGQAIVGMGSGYTLGQVAGSAFITLTGSEMPQHNHNWMASSNAAATVSPVGNLLASAGIYNGAGGTSMAANELQNAGGSQPHENRSPFLVLNWCIAMVGIFPSRG